MTYQYLKEKLKDNQTKIILGGCFVLVFLVGYGTGKFNTEHIKGRIQQPNYTTNFKAQPAQKPVAKPTAEAAKPEVAGAVTLPPAGGDAACVVKGNIAAKGVKIYHVVGGASYKRVKPEQCFATEEQAKAAGFVKASR